MDLASDAGARRARVAAVLAVFFLVGALDEFAVDVVWLWLRLTGRVKTWRIERARRASARSPGRPRC
jgi:hypothetical protein